MKIFTCKSKKDFEDFISKGGDINEKNTKNQNILFYVNDPSLCNFLIHAGADVNCIDSKKENALFGSSVAKMQVLIKNGINVNQINNRSENALFYVKNVKEAKLLLESGSDVNQCNRFKRNVLFNTRMSNELFETFLQHDINVNVKDSEGSPLIFSLNFTLMKLVEKYKTDVNWHLQHKNGESALFKYFMFDEVNFLLSKGVNPNVVDDKTKTPFFFEPYFLKQSKNLSLLKKFNADLCILNKDKMNFITKMLTTRNDNDCSYEWLKELFSLFPEIKEKNLLNQINWKGDTIANSLQVKNEKILKLLIDNALDINFINPEGADIFTNNYHKAKVLVACGYKFSESSLKLLKNLGAASENYLNMLTLFMEHADNSLKSRLNEVLENKSGIQKEKIIELITQYEKREIEKNIENNIGNTLSIRKRI